MTTYMGYDITFEGKQFTISQGDKKIYTSDGSLAYAQYCIDLLLEDMADKRAMRHG